MNEPFTPNWYSFPGSSIKEALKEQKISHEEFSKLMGITNKDVNLLFNGEYVIDEPIAKRLSEIIGPPNYKFWINRERNYRETRLRLETGNNTI